MKYIKLVISIVDRYQEVLIAELLDMEFDSFEQQDDKLITYISKERFNDVNREHIERLLNAFPGNGYIESEEIVADQNWNQEWEQTIQPQQIGKFYVKPAWASGSAPTETILLEIDPKMAFGTGYHETTRLMLKLLPEVINGDGIVLDAGTGTGILAIASVKLGACESYAFDIDEWSIQNAKENVLINQVENSVQIFEGSIEVIPEQKKFDTILANINRNAIIDLLPNLVDKLKPAGFLVLSGLQESDRETILQQRSLDDFELIRAVRENEWIAISLLKTS